MCDDWKHHGSKIPHADEIWTAIMGPDSPARGEVSEQQQLYQNQIAKTLAAFLALEYTNNNKAGSVIELAKYFSGR